MSLEAERRMKQRAERYFQTLVISEHPRLLKSKKAGLLLYL